MPRRSWRLFTRGPRDDLRAEPVDHQRVVGIAVAWDLVSREMNDDVAVRLPALEHRLLCHECLIREARTTDSRRRRRDFVVGPGTDCRSRPPSGRVEAAPATRFEPINPAAPVTRILICEGSRTGLAPATALCARGIGRCGVVSPMLSRDRRLADFSSYHGGLP